jgi:oligoribonuclease (3'-5' exoribonuclease)
LFKFTDNNFDGQLSIEELERAIQQVKEVKLKWKEVQGFIERGKNSMGVLESKADRLLHCFNNWIVKNKK